MGNRPLSLAQQLAIFDAHSSDVLDGLADYIAERRGLILKMARRRLADGYRDYGDAMFHWPLERTYVETDEELADAVNYLLRRFVG